MVFVASVSQDCAHRGGEALHWAKLEFISLLYQSTFWSLKPFRSRWAGCGCTVVPRRSLGQASPIYILSRLDAPCRHADCVQFLLDQGANPFLTDKVGSLSPAGVHQIRVMLAALTWSCWPPQVGHVGPP